MGIKFEFELLMSNAKRLVAASAPPSATPPEGSVLGERWGERVWLTPEGWALKATGEGVEVVLCHEVEIDDGWAWAVYRPWVWDGNRGGAKLAAWVASASRRIRVCEIQSVWRSPPGTFAVHGAADCRECNTEGHTARLAGMWGTPQEVDVARKGLLAALLG